MIENPEVIGIFYLYIVAMDQKSDIVIIGGGLAGLTASIHLAKIPLHYLSTMEAMK